MSTILPSFGSGGANLTPNDSAGQPSLADALRDVADDLNDLAPIPVWQTAIVVVAHTVVLANPGTVVSVDGDVGAAPGGKVITGVSLPAAGEVLVAYDGVGIPTLTFNAADAITQCAVVQVPFPTIRTAKG